MVAAHSSWTDRRRRGERPAAQTRPQNRARPASEGGVEAEPMSTGSAPWPVLGHQSPTLPKATRHSVRGNAAGGGTGGGRAGAAGRNGKEGAELPQRDSERIESMLESIENDVTRLRPRKERLQQCVEDALRDSDALRGCYVEVVGSTSWGGEVPQSDLDLVLCTPQRGLEGREAVAVLDELRQVLERRAQDNVIKRVELVDAARVPILRCIDPQGMSCDVSIDRFRALEHRTFLQEALEGRPEVRSLIRLVKSWLRRRGLPMAAEGGIASLAWAVTALILSAEQPRGTSVEVLLLHFFSEMRHLGEQSLTVRHRLESDHNADFEWNQVHLKIEWKRRSGQPVWKDEWVRLFFAEDPTLAARRPEDGGNRGSASSHFSGLTPPSIPAALAVFYIAELRLAWKAVKEGNWDELWRVPSPEARSLLPSKSNVASQKALLQMILKDGVVHLGQLLEVRKCPTVQHDAALHRRDQSSELVVQLCCLKKESAYGGPRVKERSEPPFVCQPCHWICALPTWAKGITPGDGLSRLAEISMMVEVASLEPGVLRVSDAKGQHVQRPSANTEVKLVTGLQQMTKVHATAKALPLRSTMRPGIVNPSSATGDGYPQQAHSDESTRASDRNSDSDDDSQRASVNGKPQQIPTHGSLQQAGRAPAPRPGPATDVRKPMRAAPPSAAPSSTRGPSFQGSAAGAGSVCAEKGLHSKGAVRTVVATLPVSHVSGDQPLVGHDSSTLPSNVPVKSAKPDVATSAKTVSRCLDKANLDNVWVSGKDVGTRSGTSAIVLSGSAGSKGADAAAGQETTTQSGGMKKENATKLWSLESPDGTTLRSFGSCSRSAPTSNVIQAKSGSNWGLVLALNLDAPMWCRR